MCQQACQHGAISMQNDSIQMDWGLCRSCGDCVAVCYAEGRQMVGRKYSVDEVMAIVERDREFYRQSGGGVTFTGGEPLMQVEFLGDLLSACKAAGLHTALDTSGYSRWAVLEKVRSDVDIFLYDLKLIDDLRHQKYIGVSNRTILENLRHLSEAGHTIWLRIPLIPGINDDMENLRASAVLAASLPGVQRIDLLPYHASAEAKYLNMGKSYRLPGLISPGKQQMQELVRRMQEDFLSVHIGG
ncbi:MAG TPA: glycyl-radical enzyme activating protein [Anaerolineaceae bacterium]|nr:glycyl-radical enzyme activating protein [Anaerolineaceae bacterium]